MKTRLNMVDVDTDSIRRIDRIEGQLCRVYYKKPVILNGKSCEWQNLYISPDAPKVIHDLIQL